MKHLYLITLLFFLCYPITTKSQVNNNPQNVHENDSFANFLKRNLVVTTYQTNSGFRNDTVTLAYDKYFNQSALQRAMTDSILMFRDFNPAYFRMFVPFTYYYAPISSLSTVDWETSRLDKDSIHLCLGPLPSDSTHFNTYLQTNQIVNRALLSAYTKDYRWVKTTEDKVMSREVFREFKPSIPQETHVVNLFEPEPMKDVSRKPSLKLHRPNWWIHGGSYSLQFTQNYVTNNWYQGGQSTNTVLGSLAFNANYNDKEKVIWENLFEGRLGITSSPSDTVHNYLVYSDLLRVYSKLGIQATKRWYYTITGELNTQFCNAYSKNSTVLQSAFFAPANFTFTVGMDFKYNKKALNFSLLLSPAAYSMRYVGNSKVNEVNFGLKQGDDFLHNIGSKVTTTWTLTLFKSISWSSRAYYFTNYKRGEAEWENTVNFNFNRYISAQLFAKGRFDDSTTRSKKHGYFQYKEYLSFGLHYSW